MSLQHDKVKGIKKVKMKAEVDLSQETQFICLLKNGGRREGFGSQISMGSMMKTHDDGLLMMKWEEL